MIWVIGIPVMLAIVHLINWLVVKGIIWVTYELFNYSLYDKFWPVYVALIITGMILRQIGATHSSHGGKT